MFDPWYMMLALLSSAIGTGAFIYGKRMQDAKFLAIGAILFLVSYFITNPLALGATTAALTAGLFSDSIQSWAEGRGRRTGKIQSASAEPPRIALRSRRG